MPTPPKPLDLGAAGVRRAEEFSVPPAHLGETIDKVKEAHRSCYEALIQASAALDAAKDPTLRKQLLGDLHLRIKDMIAADIELNAVNQIARETS